MAQGKKTGGRQKGTPNRKNAALVAAVEASGLTPLEYMLSVLRSPETPPDMKFEAAKAAAPYVHARLAAVEHAGPGGGPLQVQEVEWTIVDPQAQTSDRPRLRAIAGGK